MKNRLGKVLADLGVSQYRLAKETGITAATISRIVRGHDFYAKNLVSICLALGVSADEVLGLALGSEKDGN